MIVRLRASSDRLKVGGRWVYLYRAVDKAGRTGRFLPEPNSQCERCKDFSP